MQRLGAYLETGANDATQEDAVRIDQIDRHSSLQGGDDNLWEREDLYAIEGDTLANVQPMTDETGDPNISPDEYNDYLVSGSGHDFMFGEAGSDMSAQDRNRAGEERARRGQKRTYVEERDDDIVARQLREAAEKEKDPVLKEKLWKEYEEYKKDRQ